MNQNVLLKFSEQYNDIVESNPPKSYRAFQAIPIEDLGGYFRILSMRVDFKFRIGVNDITPTDWYTEIRFYEDGSVLRPFYNNQGNGNFQFTDKNPSLDLSSFNLIFDGFRCPDFFYFNSASAIAVPATSIGFGEVTMLVEPLNITVGN